MSLQEDVAAAFKELNELRERCGTCDPQNADEGLAMIRWHVQRT